jgi:hypothetical protein
MGQPLRGHTRRPPGRAGGTGGTETSQYPEEQKSNEIPSVAASERGGAQTPTAQWPASLCGGGVVRPVRRSLPGPRGVQQAGSEAKRLERRAAAGDSPVAGPLPPPWRRRVSTAGHEKPRGKPGRPRSKAQYTERPIAHEYREGKVKSTPARGVKESLKPSAHSQREAGRPSLGRGRG